MADRQAAALLAALAPAYTIMVDYYNLLGIPPDAPRAALRQAFRTRAKRVHPDAHPGLQGEERERQHRRFIQLAQAYDTLSDPARRAAYDRQWRARFGAAPGAQAGARARPRSASRPAAANRPRSASRPQAANRPRPGSSGAAGGSSAEGRPGAGRPGPTPDLETLLGEVEHLLGRFGLDLKQPAERLLDALLDWARELFQQVGDLLEGSSGSAGSAGPSASGPGTGRSAAGHSDTGHSETGQAGTGGSAAGARNPGQHRARARAGPGGRASGATDDRAAIERELARLKQRAGAGHARPGRDHGPSDIEAELQRLKGKRPKG